MTRTEPADDPNTTMALAEQLRPVLLRLLRQLRRESHDMGVSPLQALLLAAIRKHPGIGVGELAQLENLRGPTISGHVKVLEALGLVARESPDDGDRRRVGLVATKNGDALIEAIKRSRTDWLAQRLAALSPASRQAIRAAIAPLTEILE